MKNEIKECDCCDKRFKKGDIVLCVLSDLPDGYPADVQYFCNEECFEDCKCEIYSYMGMWKKIGDENYHKDWEVKD